METSQLFEISTERDLDFAKADTFYATHRMHSFSAKFPPQLPDWGLDTFSQPGDWVLDPFVGSGTLMVEARLRGRHSLGIDIDPLSRLISRVKSSPIDPVLLDKKVLAILSELPMLKMALQTARAEQTVDDFLRAHHADIPDFPNRDYWFLRPVQEELALLKALISQQSPRDIVGFLYVVYSAIIITKGKTSVANVRDLAHSRPHYAEPQEVPDVFGQFERTLNRLAKGLNNFTEACDKNVQARIIGEDARQVPLPDNCIDLVFTSPPYVNAIDYPRAHKFSIFWLADFLHISPDAYKDLGREFVGTDRVPMAECAKAVDADFGIALLDQTIAELAAIDIKRAGVANRYFHDMQAALREMCRVLRPDRKAVVIVSPSNLKGIEVQTHQILAMLAENVRVPDRQRERDSTFEVSEIAFRVLDDSKRQLPYLRGNNGAGMRNEYVIILTKRSVLN